MYLQIFCRSFGGIALQRSSDLILQLDSFADSVFDDWVSIVPGAVEGNVKKFILDTKDSVLLVNYSPDLNELMEEAKQMTILGKKTLPTSLQELALKSDSMWSARARLCDLCEDYNEFKRTTNTFELQLLTDKVVYVEEGIKQCCTVYTWDTFDIAVIVTLFESIHTLHGQTQEIQNNIANVLRGIEKWGQEPFYNRKDKNPKELLDLPNRQEILRGRKMECEKSRRQLANAIDKNKQLFEVFEETGRTADLFVDYLNFVDGEVLNSLKWAVYQNLLFLQHEMQRPGTEPLFEVKVLVKDRTIAFSPSLEDPLDMLSQKSESFIYIIEMILGDICSMADAIPRVAKDAEISFMTELREDEDIGDVKHEVRMCVLKVIKDMTEFVRRFDKYTFLYTNNQESIIGHAQEPKIDEFRENVRTGSR